MYCLYIYYVLHVYIRHDLYLYTILILYYTYIHFYIHFYFCILIYSRQTLLKVNCEDPLLATMMMDTLHKRLSAV